jgi:arsenical pump membrane protein
LGRRWAEAAGFGGPGSRDTVLTVLPLLSLFAALALLAGVLTARPHGMGLVVGAAGALGIALAGGAVVPGDLLAALSAQWRPFVTLLGIMVLTGAAEQLGLLARVASAIEPRTRGPVKNGFRITYLFSIVVAAALSNDAAILVLTPVVLGLIQKVYPKRHPRLLLPFAFAIFGAAGVAPLVISNPMNLIFAEHVGLDFNRYAQVMVPVAVAGWVVTYAVLAWHFRDVLSDEKPAIGTWPGPPPPLAGGRLLVMALLAAVLLAYPAVSWFEGPIWMVAASGAALAVLLAAREGIGPVAVSRGIAWSLFPFLVCVFVLALGLERVGVVDALVGVYRDAPAPLATMGVISAAGSALLNNHPMSVINALAMDRLPGAGEGRLFAALVGGDLGPRLLPMGSLAGLLWFDALRRHGVQVSVVDFVKVGALTAVPALVVSLGVLKLLVG